MADYPNIRPPLISGQSLDKTDRVVRTDFDYGNSRSRMRYLRAKTVISCTALYTQAEFTVFANWFDSIVNFGQDYFNITLNTGVGQGETISAKFTEVYSASRQSGLWAVSMSLEVAQTATELSPLTADEIEAFNSYYNVNDFAVFEAKFNNEMLTLGAAWDA